MATADLDEITRIARARLTLPEPPERRAIRERVGLAQSDLAGALGVTGPTLSRWETGERVPSRQLLVGYARLLTRLSALNDERPATTPGVVTTSARQGRDADSAV